MHQGRALGVAFMVLCSSVGSVTAEEKKPTNAIRVVEATYGGNCTGVAKGNVTKFVASTCDGTDLCNYRVYYKNMDGDPAPGCKKAFRVNYVCGKNRKPETCDLEAEAGMGGDRRLEKAKPREEGTRRAVNRPPLTAPAATPNSQSPSSPWQWR